MILNRIKIVVETRITTVDGRKMWVLSSKEALEYVTNSDNKIETCLREVKINKWFFRPWDALIKFVWHKPLRYLTRAYSRIKWCILAWTPHKTFYSPWAGVTEWDFCGQKFYLPELYPDRFTSDRKWKQRLVTAIKLTKGVL
jgi:hypothetical protein